MKKSIQLFVAFFSTIVLFGCAQKIQTPTAPSESVPYASPPQTTNKMALRIYDKLPIYAAASKMSWEPIQDNNIEFKRKVRERLTALGIGHPESLPNAIAEFQSQNDLKVTRKINDATLAALNIPPAERYKELVQSMNDWAKYPEDQNSRYVLVNIPEYKMKLIDHGNELFNMKVIVGRPSRQTPLLSSKITTIVFNPTWTVPKTILAKDIIPGMQSNPNYLKEHYDMRVYANHSKDAPEINPITIDWRAANIYNFDYRVTAPASDVNPLGRIKFIFENDQDIYMHDTPEKSLFALHDRARSSGCIRLEDPMALVQYFYADNKDLNAELVHQYLSNYTTKYIALRNPMPVYIVYIPAWVDANGQVYFAKNIYANKNVGESPEMKKTIA